MSVFSFVFFSSLCVFFWNVLRRSDAIGLNLSVEARFGKGRGERKGAREAFAEKALEQGAKKEKPFGRSRPKNNNIFLALSRLTCPPNFRNSIPTNSNNNAWLRRRLLEGGSGEGEKEGAFGESKVC